MKPTDTTPAADALVLHPQDNVATALRDLAAGQIIHVGGVNTPPVQLVQDIPLCHKFALLPMAAGTAIRKYGEPIGQASRDIAAGEHVHVHNLRSTRARQA